MKIYRVVQRYDLICNGKKIDGQLEETYNVATSGYVPDAIAKSVKENFKPFTMENDETGKKEKYEYNNINTVEVELLAEA